MAAHDGGEGALSTASIIVVVVIAVVVLGLLGLAAGLFGRARQRRGLRDQFGPEYAHTVDATGGDRRRAEADLKNRLEQRKSLAIQPISPAQRDLYQQEWRTVQAAFVDSPGTALGQADSLITSVMVGRGYPVQDFEEQADLVSVDHPQVVEHYRKAHGIYIASQTGAVPTEDMREAFVSFRALFSELVENGRTEVGAMGTGPLNQSTT